MTILHTDLCIGGPYAGKQIQCDKPYFHVATPDDPLYGVLHDRLNRASPCPPPGIKRTCYVKQTLITRLVSISFWAPDDQSKTETLQLLFAEYEKSKRDYHEL